MFETIINYIDGTKESSKLNINVSGEVTTATLAVKELDYKKIASIDVLLRQITDFRTRRSGILRTTTIWSLNFYTRR